MIPVDDLFDVVVDSSAVGHAQARPGHLHPHARPARGHRTRAGRVPRRRRGQPGRSPAGGPAHDPRRRPARPGAARARPAARPVRAGRADGRRPRIAVSEAAVPLPGPPGPPPDVPAAARRRADLALVVAAFFFGTTFLVVQDAVEDADPVPFLAVRFLIGGRRPRRARPGSRRHAPRAAPRRGRRRALLFVGLRAADRRAAVHVPVDVGVHHLPARGVRPAHLVRGRCGGVPTRSRWSGWSWPSPAWSC